MLKFQLHLPIMKNKNFNNKTKNYYLRLRLKGKAKKQIKTTQLRYQRPISEENKNKAKYFFRIFNPTQTKKTFEHTIRREKKTFSNTA